ncbi:MAG: hypothetical protein ABL921_11665 [Pirellula sp.]
MNPKTDRCHRLAILRSVQAVVRLYAQWNWPKGTATAKLPSMIFNAFSTIL